MLFNHLDSSRSGRPIRRAAILVGVTAVPCLALFATSGSAGATTTATVSVSPDTGLVSGNSVTVTVTTPNDTPSNVFVAVTQCGNATSSGTPLTALATDGSDCVGAAGFGSTLQVIGAGGAASPSGPVTAGTYHATLKLQESSIGTANAKCIAMPPATLPCTIVVSTATITGAYTGTGAFQGQAPITYANNVSTTTTTTVASHTTTTQAHSSGSSTTIAAGTGSSSAGTPTTSSGTGAQSAAGSTAANSSLAATGPSALTWLMAVGALVLLDLGYLALSATWRTRRAGPDRTSG